MILLVIPSLILYFGGDIGKIYVLAGIVSLSLDWFLFYLPGFEDDKLLLQSILKSSGTLDEQGVKELTAAIHSYNVKQIFHVQYQSLGWWIFTSWRWTTILNSSYRNLVGMGFITAAVHDPLLHADPAIMRILESNTNRNTRN